jgi:hypothetical protein
VWISCFLDAYYTECRESNLTIHVQHVASNVTLFFNYSLYTVYVVLLFSQCLFPFIVFSRTLDLFFCHLYGNIFIRSFALPRSTPACLLITFQKCQKLYRISISRSARIVSNGCIFYHFFSVDTIFRCVRKIVKSDYYISHVCLSVCPSVRLSAWNGSTPTGQIFMKFDI